MTIQRSQVIQAFAKIIEEKKELSAIDKANVLSQLKIESSIPSFRGI